VQYLTLWQSHNLMGGNLVHTKCKIGSIELQDNFDVDLKKREYFVLYVKNISKETHYKFYLLKNHFVNCDIIHEKLTYLGHVSIRGVSDYYEETYPLSISIKICFES